MVYRRYRPRRFRRYRRRYRRPSWFTSARRTVAPVWKAIKTIKNQLNVEYKHKDPFSQSDQTVTSGSNRLLLNGLTKGDDINHREARQIRMKSVQLALNLEQDSASTFTRYKVVLLLDRFPNHTTFSATDVWDSTAILSMRNRDNRRRFWILKEWTGNLVKTDNTVKKQIKFYRRFDIKTIYNDADNGTIADIESNALFLYMITDDVNGMNVETSARITWIDN